ncbi:hypothetical protein BEL04_00420 [Mucilaginibacter sp. PPCGB 2223]|nr:hypothetical protein BEL04_00420 [Mucilaginibacter sp. PPCGB 2223]
MFGLPFIFYIFMMVSIFSAATSGNAVNVFGVFKFFPILMLLVIGVQFGWFWSVAVGLQPKVPEIVKMKIKRFKVFFFIPLVYMALMIGLMCFLLSSVDFLNPQGSGLFAAGVNPAAILVPFAVIIPLHLFSIFCIFYCLYFVAKTLKTAEVQKEVEFSDFAAEFFLIWFYPIGIWFIQPRINKLIQEPSLDAPDEKNSGN